MRLEGRGIRTERASRLYETRPISGSAGPAYLNACVLVQSRLSPRELLSRCLDVEREAGRVRRARWEARPLDIDVIFHGGERRGDGTLQLPHPGWRERDFILAGLLDLGIERDPTAAGGRAGEIRHWLTLAEGCILSAHSWPFTRSTQSPADR